MIICFQNVPSVYKSPVKSLLPQKVTKGPFACLKRLAMGLLSKKRHIKGDCFHKVFRRSVKAYRILIKVS